MGKARYFSNLNWSHGIYYTHIETTIYGEVGADWHAINTKLKNMFPGWSVSTSVSQSVPAIHNQQTAVE